MEASSQRLMIHHPVPMIESTSCGGRGTRSTASGPATRMQAPLPYSWPVSFRLERNLASQLPESGLVRGCGLSKISIREIHVNATASDASKAREVHVICPVKE